MADKVKHSGIYERMVSDEHDFLGQAAYSIYKARKREFIIRKQAELGTARVPEELVNEFVEAQSDYTSSYGNEIAKEKERIAHEYREKYEKLAESVKPSFWYGVLQGVVSSFLFVLAGYIILKMNGSWDILLSNLFK